MAVDAVFYELVSGIIPDNRERYRENPLSFERFGLDLPLVTACLAPSYAWGIGREQGILGGVSGIFLLRFEYLSGINLGEDLLAP